MPSQFIWPQRSIPSSNIKVSYNMICESAFLLWVDELCFALVWLLSKEQDFQPNLKNLAGFNLLGQDGKEVLHWTREAEV